jgi:twitching motility protein PilT
MSTDTHETGHRPPETLIEILTIALKDRASDVHLKEGRPPAFRMDGRLRFTNWPPVSHEQMDGFLDEILGPKDKQRFLETGDADHALSEAGLGRFRANCYRQRGVAAIVLRHLKTDIPDFASLHLPVAAMDKIASFTRGLVLITGTTSSGKSTTLASLVERINESREGHIVTIEDPIEFLHNDKRCSVSQREVGIDTVDFRSGLRAVMREDPNVILIGEMRDPDSFEACVSASETGHLVLTTLHTSNVLMTVDRILDMFAPALRNHIRSQLALQLKAIVSQRLLPAASGHGRVPAVEVLFNNPGIAALIREDDLQQLPAAIAAGHEEGMQSFNQSLVELVKSGLVTQEAAEAASDNPDELKMNLQGIYLSRDRGRILKKHDRS